MSVKGRWRIESAARAIIAAIRARGHVSFEAMLGEGFSEEFPERRAFAYCIDSDPPTVVYAPKLTRQPEARIVALLAHELAGHALFFHLGRPEHSERDADALAERTLGIKIFYDKPDWVQTLDPRNAVRPRPSHLPR